MYSGRRTSNTPFQHTKRRQGPFRSIFKFITTPIKLTYEFSRGAANVLDALTKIPVIGTVANAVTSNPYAQGVYHAVGAVHHGAQAIGEVGGRLEDSITGAMEGHHLFRTDEYNHIPSAKRVKVHEGIGAGYPNP